MVSCRVIGALKLPNVLPVLEKLKPGVPVLGVLPNPVDVGFVPNPVVDVVPNPVPNVFVDGWFVVAKLKPVEGVDVPRINFENI